MGEATKYNMKKREGQAEKVGPVKANEFDVIIIGGGGAGLTAAVYLARAGKKTLVVDRFKTTWDNAPIENYLGFENIVGKDLLEIFRKHARKFGAEIKMEEVLGAHDVGEGDDKHFVVTTDKGEYTSKWLIIATGLYYRKPPIADLEKFESKGVAYCVACDGYFFRGKKVFVVGSQSYAAHEAIQLLDYTKDITIFTNGEKTNINEALLKMLRENKIVVREEKIKVVFGEQMLRGVVLAGGERLAADGLFVAVGQAGPIELARQLGIFFEGPYLKVNDRFETNVGRVYAVGDCTGIVPQISTCSGSGAAAACNILAKMLGLAKYVQY